MAIDLECGPIFLEPLSCTHGLEFHVVCHVSRPLIQQFDALIDCGFDVHFIVYYADVACRAIRMATRERLAKRNVVLAYHPARDARDQHSPEK